MEGKFIDLSDLVFVPTGSKKVCFFSFDTRDQDVTEARHWSDLHIMAGRAFFREQEEPPHLALENVLASDIGSYKCRVDFYKAPTQISEVLLNVIGKMFQGGLTTGDLSKANLEKREMIHSLVIK